MSQNTDELIILRLENKQLKQDVILLCEKIKEAYLQIEEMKEILNSVRTPMPNGQLLQ